MPEPRRRLEVISEDESSYEYSSSPSQNRQIFDQSYKSKKKFKSHSPSPIKILTTTFIITKLLLISLLLLVPKEYDTSTRLIVNTIESSTQSTSSSSSSSSIQTLLSQIINRIIRKLTIWDSVYFSTLSYRGILYEHEYAFGIFWWLTIRIITNFFTLIKDFSFSFSNLLSIPFSAFALENNVSLESYALTSIIISNLCHYLSTLLLYKLTLQIFPSRGKRFAQITSTLYIFSPAGIFLVAGYTENIFALLSFSGLLLREHEKYVLSGLIFAISCGYRSNGLFWGIVLLYDFLNKLKQVQVSIINGRRINSQLLAKTLSIFIGGLLIAVIFISLQYYAYTQYCTSDSSPEWCNYKIPSITSYVQNKYWKVGFLKYWTPNNIPNFLFALPTLYIIWKSSIEIIKNKNFIKGSDFRDVFNSTLRAKVDNSRTSYSYSPSKPTTSSYYLLPYVIVQSVTALAALFVWNVQIITRISTCFPLIYWYTAHLLTSTSLRDIEFGRKVITFAIIWIIAQCILFSAFLPPA